MGEIRSTMDIIMEKTKGLTLTEKEKEAFRRTEIERKMRGLLQRFLDGLINLTAIKEEIGSMDPIQRRMAKEALVKECVDNMEVEGENAPLFDLLEYLIGPDTQGLRKTLEGLRADLEEERKAREGLMRESLEKAGISGSAIIPNIQADPEWGRYLSGMRGELKQKLVLQAQDLT